MPTGQSVPEMCWLCGASPSGPRGFCNVARGASWRATYKSHESYVASCYAKGKQPGTLMGIKVLRLEGFLPDAMHGMDEGFTAEVAGNLSTNAWNLRVCIKSNQSRCQNGR